MCVPLPNRCAVICTSLLPQRDFQADKAKFEDDTERLVALSNKVREQSAAVAKERAAAAAERQRAQKLRDECAALAAQADADKQVVEHVAADIRVRASSPAISRPPRAALWVRLRHVDGTFCVSLRWNANGLAKTG